MGSVGGPMLLFFFPQILALSNIVVGWKSGYLVDWNRRWKFWVIFFSFVVWNFALIMYHLQLSPAIKIWYYTKDFDVETIVARAKAERLAAELLAR